MRSLRMQSSRFLQASRKLLRKLFRSNRQAARATAEQERTQREIQQKQIVMMQLAERLQSNRRPTKPET